MLIGGPTASGKSGLVLELANHIPIEIVNADSRQVYQQLRIGTSRPQACDLQQVPHHLYGFLRPDESFSAADFERLASDLIPQIAARNRLPVLVGGTGFYMKALLRGVWPVLPKNEQLRTRLRKIGSRHHPWFLHNMLARLDPESAAAIAPPDTYRLIRALEIYFQTGIRRSNLPVKQDERFNAMKFYLDLPREELHAKIVKRTELMFDQGWVEEVERLIALYPDFTELPASKSLGYREIFQHLSGEMTVEECKSAVVLKTRQYAKRQLTWFRNQDQFEPLPSEVSLHKLIDCVLQWYRN
ncbi:MAG: tRNA (adenosine(37)-N6)-dimethylallyltransferase MiaA [Acidobacteriota bacterium]